VAIAEARAVEIERRADDLQRELARATDENTELVRTFAATVARMQTGRAENGKRA
jgi:hypothetical protein